MANTLPTPDRDARLDQVLADYLHAVEAGRPPTRDALLAEYPDFAADIESFLRNRAAVERVAAPLRDRPPLSVTIDGSSTPEVVPGPGTVLRYFGDYEVLSEIARGGMGVVYQARQVSLNRVVALKMILRGELATPTDVQRFRAEAEVAANLDHPHIVPIYEVGEHAGQHYFSMKLVNGGSLNRHVQDLIRAPRAAAGLLATVARAVHHAHQRGLLHRDLKPANILVDAQGEPHITDFGLAKHVGRDSQLTQSGAIVGTPSYMAPEQASGQKVLTVGADVYSLGAILYELLTGRPPFRAETPLDTVLQVLDRDPERPRQVDTHIDRDLETICLKCLQKDAQRRYDSAAALAEDLERWLKGEPIVARPTTAVEKCIKWARRRPAAAALVAVSLTAAAGLLAGGLFFNARLQRLIVQVKDQQSAMAQANELAQQDRETARQANELAQQRLQNAKGLLLSSQSTAVLPINPGLALVLAIEGAKRNPGLVANNTLQAALDECLERRTLLGHTSEVLATAFSPDGRLLVTTSKDGTARLWDTATGKTLFILKDNEGTVTFATFSPDSRRVLTLAPRPDRCATVWDTATGNPLCRLKLTSNWDQRFQGPNGWGTPENAARYGARFTDPTEYRMASFSPDGNSIVTAFGEYPDCTARIWDARTGKERAVLEGHEGPVGSASFSPDGKWIVTASLDTTARIWDTKTGKQVHVLKGHSGGVFSAAFSPNGQRVLTIGEGHTYTFAPAEGYRSLTLNVDALEPSAGRLWDPATGKQVAALEWPPNPGAISAKGVVRRGEFSPDGRWVVTAGWRYFAINGSGTPRVWDAVTGKQCHLLEGTQGGDINALSFSPKGDRMVTASGNHTAVIWDMGSMKEIATLRGHERPVVAAVFRLDGKEIATASEDKTVRLWTAPLASLGAVLLWRTPYHKREVVERSLVVFSHDGQRFHTAPESVRAFWETTAGKQVRNAHPAPASLTTAFNQTVFGPENRCVLLGSIDREVAWIHDTTTGKEIATLQPRNPSNRKPTLGNGFATLEFNPDGTRVLATSGFGNAYLFDAATGRELLSADTNWALFSPDGRRVLMIARGDRASGSFWDAATGERLGALEPAQAQPKGEYTAVAFSPDSRRVLVACPDHTVRLCDVADGRELFVLRGHSCKVNDVVFSPDGQRVLTVADDLAPRIWDASTGKELFVLRGHVSGIQERQFGVFGGAFSPDSKLVVTCGKEGIARLWSVANGHELAAWNGPTVESWNRFQFRAAFSHDGQTVLTIMGSEICQLLPVDPFTVALARAPRGLSPDEKRRFELGSTPDE